MQEEIIKVVENDYEELTLPSNGLGIQGLTHMTVRPMTMVEEKILSNKTIAKAGKTQEEIFKAVLGKGIIRKEGQEDKIITVDLDRLLVEDEFALLLFVRAISYGRVYDTQMKCPECKTEYDVSIDLETDIKVEYANAETPKNIIVTLPMDGRKVTMHYPERRDIKKNIQDTTVQLVEKIEGVEEFMILTVLEKMKTGDFSELRKHANKCDFGVNKDISFTCENSDCDRVGEEQEVDFPITSEFFRL